MLMRQEKIHEPVLIEEVIKQLGAHLQDKKIIDATAGTAGHTVKMAENGAKVLGIEADQSMLEIAKDRLEKFSCPLVYGNFRNIDQIAKNNGFEQVDAVLFDLGVSNLQLTSPERGFSFTNPEAVLDMRIDSVGQGVTGSDLLNGLRQDQLEELFSVTLDYSASRWLAKRIVQKRKDQPIKTVGDFLDICHGLRFKPGLNPATLPFLALRIAVNTELENFKEALPEAFGLLKTGGKLLVITFHSKEKEVLFNFSRDFKGPIKPTEGEIMRNPRSRSAELFVLTKKNV